LRVDRHTPPSYDRRVPNVLSEQLVDGIASQDEATSRQVVYEAERVILA